MTQTLQNRSSFSIWLQAIRAFSFTASMVPIFVGAMLALSYEGAKRWELFPLVILCSLLMHAGTNLVSDYYDYKKGVDSPDALGGSGVLVGKLIEPKKILFSGITCFAVCFLLGLVFVQIRGVNMLYLGVIGILGGYFYSGGISYKFLALGDIIVFWLMGPLMVIGSYFVITGEFSTNVALVSMPIGFLVTAILHANNLRDIRHDSAANVRTVANIIGLDGAKIQYYFLVGAAYISVIAMIVIHILPIWTLVVLLSLPPAIKNIKTVSKANLDQTAEISMIDIQTAQHHFLFGLLLIVGLLLAVFIK
jgi:1,4-dihydroxy-2-naphthoate octaprenyltransferase